MDNTNSRKLDITKRLSRKLAITKRLRMKAAVKAHMAKFLATVEQSPPQRSAEWYKIRKNTIGGSEVDKIVKLKDTPYCLSLVAEKLGITSFKGCLFTRWGNIFEHVTKQWTELALNMEEEIIETGSIRGAVEGQRYSPDGLGCILLTDDNGKFKYYLVLFEFKSPITRIPITNKIPSNYKSQIKTGLASIPNSEFGVYVDNCYRKCALEDLGFNKKYDKKFHYSDEKKIKNKKQELIPYACGVLCFYQTEQSYYDIRKHLGYSSDSDSSDSDEYYDEYHKHQFEDCGDLNSFLNFNDNTDDSNKPIDIDKPIPIDTSNDTAPESKQHEKYKEHDIELLFNSKHNMLDLGKSGVSIINRLFELYDDKRIGIKYYPMIANYEQIQNIPFIQQYNIEHDTEGNKNFKRSQRYTTDTDIQYYARKCINKFKDTCDEKMLHPIGYMPWKLMFTAIAKLDEDPTWIDKIKEPVEKHVKLLNELQSSEDIKAAFNTRFPNRKKQNKTYQYDIEPEELSECQAEDISNMTDIMSDCKMNMVEMTC